MQYIQIPLGPLQTNAYLLINENKDCVIFDPGSEGEAFNHYLAQNKLNPIAILLTHAHFDHIGAVEEVRKNWNIPVYIHENEENWLIDPALNGSHRFPFGEIKASKAEHLIKEEGTLTVGAFTFQVLFTPGHSPGSISFYHEETEAVFAGDALFAGSIGRTDLPGGDHQLLIKSIHDKLLSLPEETTVLPGHGQETTIGVEMDSNPFLNGF
ncbi:MBL fold metallo-hydrolase [Bacillus sp. FJAT-45066]|uniref:MBL fold metallo-hydrolase n=1 Tax=Bacillus sp. FJAT-45066 TaxID=2011010 RepID=UPI000BB6F9D6|nr:MBL fold metallo-hydrolase [Bacillus sp. FJAT-45066]